MGVAWFSGWEVIVRTLVAGSVTYLVLVLLLRVTGPARSPNGTPST